MFFCVALLLGTTALSPQARPLPAPPPAKTAKVARLAPGLEALTQLAEASVKAETSVRLAVLNEVAIQLCAKGEKARCQKLLEEVLSSTPASADGSYSWLSAERTVALQTLADLDLDRAVQLAEQEQWGGDIIGLLAQRLADRNRLDRATELLKSAGPMKLRFDAAVYVARKLPKDADDPRFFDLFSLSREAFYGGSSVQAAGAGFDAFLVDFQDRIPPTLLVGTMLDVLKATQEHERDKPIAMTVGAKAGTVTFGSTYEFLAFEFLPVIRRYDPAKAEAIERDTAQLAALNRRYPEGIDSLMPKAKDSKSGRDRQMDYISYGGDPEFQRMQTRQDDSLRQFERRSETVLQQDPKQALANSSALDKDNRYLFLGHVIRRFADKQPSIEREAADQFVSLAVSEDAGYRAQRLLQLARLLGEVRDNDHAATVLRDVLPELGKAYEWDTAPADPKKSRR